MDTLLTAGREKRNIERLIYRSIRSNKGMQDKRIKGTIIKATTIALAIAAALLATGCGAREAKQVGLNDVEESQQIDEQEGTGASEKTGNKNESGENSDGESGAEESNAEESNAEESNGIGASVEEETMPDKLPADGLGWGLSYGESGTQPVGNASAEALAQYDAYYLGNAEEKVIYLTFDCGYENGNTEPILDALKNHDVQATFFVVGHFLETAPELVQRMVDEGHAVGSHTYHHPKVDKLSEQEFQEEMNALRDKFTEVTGEELSMYYRPPEGMCSSDNLWTAKQMGYSSIFWSLAHVDWDPENQPGRKSAIEKLTDRIHPGAIVLLHNTSKTNGEILDELLTKWEEMGYTVRPLSELIEK